MKSQEAQPMTPKSLSSQKSLKNTTNSLPFTNQTLNNFCFNSFTRFTSRKELKLTKPKSPKVIPLITIELLESFSRSCNGEYSYEPELNPKRVLTKPSSPTKNSGYDNDSSDYILCVGELIGNQQGRKFSIIDLLGHGTFGQVVKCKNIQTEELVAVKVIKNLPAYFNQSMMEVRILESLNKKWDQSDRYNIVQMKDTFIFRNHLCIVVELLSINLYELIKQNHFKGFSHQLIKIFINQLLDSLTLLSEARVVHCDLKPENILLQSLESPAIKVIDFGSACYEQQTLYTYIQSRFYRSPEVILGLPYSSSIDMWSLGCIAVELFLGLPIFPGSSNFDQISRIVETIGMPQYHMLEFGKNTSVYFTKTTGADGRNLYVLKTRDQYSKDRNANEPQSKRYFAESKLADIITAFPNKSRSSLIEKEEELKAREVFIDFVKGLLNINPIERWSPQQAKKHPYLTGAPFKGPFVPPARTEPNYYSIDDSLEEDYIEDRQLNYSRNQPNPSPRMESELLLTNQSHRRASAPSIFPQRNVATKNQPTIQLPPTKPGRKFSVGASTGRRDSVQHQFFPDQALYNQFSNMADVDSDQDPVVEFLPGSFPGRRNSKMQTLLEEENEQK